jgi:glucose/mannose-6-phosphate isomerase
MLDDLKYIHEKDVQDALGVAERQWQQLEYEISTDFGNLRNVQYDNVVLGGMGGSALAALIGETWPGLSVPFQIVRDYDIPEYVSDKTLFIASSYSGNTEETLSALEQAEAKNAVIVVIAHGGKLEEIASQKQYPFLKLPDTGQPRYATLVGLKAFVSVLVGAGLTDKSQLEELTGSVEYLKSHVASWVATIPTASNPAKQLALELIGKSIVVYAGAKFYPAAYKWKISFNENAKHVAWVNQYPEFNHNEFIGWTKRPTDKPYAVIDIRSNLEHPRTLKRFEVSERLLSGQRPAPHVINPEGKTLLQQLLWTTALGDFVSLYVAILNGLNPTPVDLIEKFKKSLDE